MIKTIVYESNTGAVERCAGRIAEAVGLAAIPLSEAIGTPTGDEPIFYMGWLQGNRIKGYNRIGGRPVAGICAVGLSRESEELMADIRRLNYIPERRVKLFYLRGGLDMQRLNPIQRFMMRIILTSAKADPKQGEKFGITLDMIESGVDFTGENDIGPIVSFIKKYNQW